MRILRVLSQHEVTGAEVYAATLADEEVRRGHHVIIVSDTWSTPVRARIERLTIGIRKYSQRIKNILSLIRLIGRERIDVVVAHSRASSWIANIATRWMKTPFVSVVHGKQHLHFSSRSVSVYGKHIIAVSESVYRHLQDDLGIDQKHLTLIPNGIVVEHWKKPKPLASRKKVFGLPSTRKIILFVGRLSGPKGDVVKFLMTDVLPLVRKRVNSTLAIVGGMRTNPDIPSALESTRAALGASSVLNFGYQKDIRPFLFSADLVVAAGRSAMESLIAGKPTVAFGETNYHGLVAKENFAEAVQTEFGDQGLYARPSAETVADDFVDCLKLRTATAPSLRVQRLAREQFDSRRVEERVWQVFARAIVECKSPKAIPVLMYHSVVNDVREASKHGIWVTAESFRAQLRSLKRRGFTSITFREYAQFQRGEHSLPPNPVILTFDDGYEDNYRVAFPIMEEFGCKSVIYLVTDKRRTNFWVPDDTPTTLMTKPHIREMAKHGHEFGSHTVTHPKLPSIPPALVRRELKSSKHACEETLGNEVISFAYPYGALNDATKQLVGEAGYQFAAAADTGPFVFYKDYLEIRRVQVFPWTSPGGFWKKTQPWYSRYKRWKK